MKTYALITLEGPDAWDFGHRMFSRNIKTLLQNHGRLTLFLSAEGKVQCLFWTIKTSTGLSLIVERAEQQNLFDLIEKYHFAENFKTLLGQQLGFTWKPTNSKAQGEGEKRGDRFTGSWRGTEFLFDLNQPSPSSAMDLNWQLHRIQNLIPQWGLDYDSSNLVFETGLEELCDSNKGCYIGQEIVERVRSRGGQSPRRLSLFEWSEKAPSQIQNIYGPQQDVLGSTTKTEPVQAGTSWWGLGFLKRGVEPTNQELKVSGIRGRCVRSI